jgi:putative SOS response-associated peptidase YedK
MCNTFGNTVAYRTYVETFSHQRIRLVFEDIAPNLEPLTMIRPTDRAPVVRPAENGDGCELVRLRWGFPPTRPKAGPLINFRSEGRRFGPGRCLVPASYFFEYTGAKSPKTRWRFTKAGEDWFCFAGLWRRSQTPEGPLDAFTLLTCEPGPDVAPIHPRQPVVLERAQWAAWLDPAAPSDSLIRPSSAGSLAVEKAS